MMVQVVHDARFGRLRAPRANSLVRGLVADPGRSPGMPYVGSARPELLLASAWALQEAGSTRQKCPMGPLLWGRRLRDGVSDVHRKCRPRCAPRGSTAHRALRARELVERQRS